MAEYSTRDRSKLFKSGLVDTADIKDGALTLDKLAPDFITEYAPKSYVDTSVSTAVSNLVDSAPGVLDTLNELAAAIGDDANFVTTINDAIDLKFDTADFDSTFDTRLATKTTDDLTEGLTSLYYTDTRVRAALSGSDGITYDSGTGAFSLTDTGVTAASYGSASLVPVITINANGQITSASTVAVAGVTNFDFTSATNTYTISTADGGSFSASGDLVAFDTGDLVEGTNLYYTDARWDTKMAAADTGDLTEGTNLYFTTARARASISVTDAGGDGSLSYNSTSGVITYTGPSAAEVRAHFSGGTGVDITDGVVSIGQPVATTDNVTFADITADSVQLTGDSLATGEGLLSWNSTDHTLDIGLANGSVLQVGQEQHFYAKADGAIPNGAVVMFSGAQGGHVLVTLADLSSVSFEDRYLVGVATNSIANGEFGYITSFGKVRSLDTSAWTEGTILYADPATPGGLTATAPTSPLHAVAIAAVVRSHAVVGEIMVRTETGAHLSELHDVHFTSTPTSGQFIRYNSTNSRWENESVDTGDIPENGNLYYTTARANTDFDTRLATKSTTNLAEGTNLYYTNTRARAAISVTDSGGDGSLSYNSATGVITYTGPSATEVRAHLSAGTGVTYSSGQFSIGQAVATTSNVTFNSVTTAGDVTVGGNLTVNGTTTTVNATNLAISDNMIYLNEGSSVTNPDLGWSGNYNDGTYAHTGVFRDASDSGKFKFFKGYTPEPSSEIDTTHASFALADVVAANFYGNLTGTVTGNASTATTLQTARTINGVSFNGSASITVEPYIEDDEGTAATRYIVFTDNSTGGYKRLNEDSSLNYNPSTNTLVAGTFSGALSGNAATASKWLTARTNTVTLTGDVTGTGNASVDGSGNWTVSLATTVAANSVALGTDTTGNYMVNVAAGGGITVSHTQGEGSTATVSHADTSSIANLSSDNANGVVIQDIALTYDTYGHAQTASVTTVDLDGRYYTETEADSRFVNVTGDTMTGQLINTRANSASAGGGQIYLNGATGNRIDWNSSGVAAPALNAISEGTKLVLYPEIGTSSTNYAMGIEGSTLWMSVPRNDQDRFFKWYHGATNTMTLARGGNLSVAGAVTAPLYSTFSQGLSANAITVGGDGNNNGTLSQTVQTTNNGVLYLNYSSTGNIVANNGGTGYFLGSTSVRSPIFYDSNNTAYYADLSSTGTAIYAAGAIEADVGNNQSSWGHPVLENRTGWGSTAYPTLGSSGGSSGSLIMLEAPHIKFATYNARAGASGRAGIRCAIDTAATSYWDVGVYGDAFEVWRSASGTQQFWIDSSGNNYARSSVRAPIFYDSDNTGYYVDPASTSNLNASITQTAYIGNTNNYINLNSGYLQLKSVGNEILIGGSASTMWVNYRAASGGTPTNYIWGAGSSTTRADHDIGGLTLARQIKVGTFANSQTNTGEAWIGRATDRVAGTLTVQLGTGTGRKFEVVDYGWSTVEFSADDSGVATAAGSMRAPIFYDNNNTGYYVDPASTSNLNEITFAGNINGGSGTYSSYRFAGRSFSWNSAMQSSGSYRPHIWQESYSGWDPVMGIKTTNGFWQFGAYSSDILHLGYMAGAYGGHATNAFDKEFTFDAGGNFVASGNVTAYSDIRFKSNIVTIPNALDKVLRLRGVNYTKDDKASTGVIAQEVEEILPEVVHTAPDEMGTKSVAYGNMVGVLIEAIKEQQTIINTQEERIAKLESLVEKLLGEK